MKFLVFAFFALSLLGCSTYSVQRYSPYTDNIMALRPSKNKTINITEFTETYVAPPSRNSVGPTIAPGGTFRNSISCRGVGPIKTPDSEPFTEYIKKALMDELKMADVYSNTGSVSLSGKIQKLDFSSNSGHWFIDLLLTSSNGQQANFSEKFEYATSFYGETACNQTAQAFMPTVQNLIGKIVKSEEFKKLTEVKVDASKK